MFRVSYAARSSEVNIIIITFELEMMTEAARKTLPENKHLDNWDYFAILSHLVRILQY